MNPREGVPRAEDDALLFPELRRQTPAVRYRAFGACIRSELELPDLPHARAGRVEWSVRVAPHEPGEGTLELLGEHEVDGARYRLHRTESGFRLDYADRYLFDIRPADREIVWYWRQGARAESARALLLGPVLALAQQIHGDMALHGSAVAIRRRGIVLLGSKHHGKSTLALALTIAGARHLSDDSALVDLSAAVRVRPGVQSFRLWSDSVAALVDRSFPGALLGGAKRTLTALPQAWLQNTAVPLASVYVLNPVVSAGQAAPAERTLLPQSLAALILAGHAKIPQPLAGRTGGAEQFRRAAEIARRVPVYQLRVARDWGQLRAVVDTILLWHDGTRRRVRVGP